LHIPCQTTEQAAKAKDGVGDEERGLAPKDVTELSIEGLERREG